MLGRPPTGSSEKHVSPPGLLSAAERRGTPVLLSASVSDNFGNSPQMAAPRRSREIDQSTRRFHVCWFHVGWQGIGDQSDAVTQNAWFRCALCAAISGEIPILIQTGAESWGRFAVPRICRWESTPGLEPGSLEYCSNALTTKLRRHMVKNMFFTSISQAMGIQVYPEHLFQGVF